MRVFHQLTELVGDTPLLRLHHIEEQYQLKSELLVKLELFNPAGSSKDRVAVKLIEDAERKGLLGPGSVIIEPTSGNTGVGLAAIGASKGYRVILTMPDTMSIERRNLLKAYGAEVILTDGKLMMQGAIAKAQELARQISNSYIPGQFTNESNPEAHFQTTGPEIYRDTDGQVDILIAGIGTGGTITGSGKYLKSKNPNIKVIGFEPAGSPYLTQKKTGAHKLQGIGAGFIPEVLDVSICDEILCITDEEALAMCQCLVKSEGVLVGITSGAAVRAAIITAQRKEYYNKKIVAILADTGERYLSMF